MTTAPIAGSRTTEAIAQRIAYLTRYGDMDDRSIREELRELRNHYRARESGTEIQQVRG